MNFKTKILVGSFLNLFFNIFWILFYIYQLHKEDDELNKKVFKKILDFHISFLLYPLLFLPFIFITLIRWDNSITDMSFIIYLIIYFINFFRYIIYFIKQDDSDKTKLTFLNKNLLSLDIFNSKWLDSKKNQEEKNEIKSKSKIYYFLNLISFWILWNIYFFINFLIVKNKLDKINIKNYYESMINKNLSYFLSVFLIFSLTIILWTPLVLLWWILAMSLLIFIIWFDYLKSFIFNVFHWVNPKSPEINFTKFSFISVPFFTIFIWFLSFYFFIYPISNYVKFTSYETKINDWILKVQDDSVIVPKPNSKEEKEDFWYHISESFENTDYWKKLKMGDDLVNEIDWILFKYKSNNSEKILNPWNDDFLEEITKEEIEKLKENDLFIRKNIKDIQSNISTLLKSDYKNLFYLQNIYRNYSNLMIWYISYLNETNQIEKNDLDIVYNYCDLWKAMSEKSIWYITYLWTKLFVKDCYVTLYNLNQSKNIEMNSEKLSEYENLKNNFFKAETESKYLAKDFLWMFSRLMKIDEESEENWKFIKFWIKISGVWIKMLTDYESLNNIKTEEDLYKFKVEQYEWKNSTFINSFIPRYWIEKMLFIEYGITESYEKINKKLLNLNISK